ncbi:hypothetical protein [Arthrobacter sp. NEB 688]|uniref:hypothetical protein n=1 Tax=Arthrobacter sp. NEB 688 TaxID=904039 RepID=UPI0015648642|nr:hypothetical protein [Arthrobacter sp. NEB 688]QKE82768.1 hypothetical protein HL663_01570 [Arthrobacter sp. NEB 688]
MKTSRYRLFVFVEGRELDVPFYDGISRTALAATGFEYTVERIVAVQGHEGKSGLEEYYEYLRDQRKLNQANSRGRVSALFFMDRDFDPIIKSQLPRTKNIALTRTYNVEAEVFDSADPVRALADLASLSDGEAARVAADLGKWQHELADKWSTWLELCVISVALGSQCRTKPKSQSRINSPVFGPVSDIAAAAESELVSTTATCEDPVVRRQVIEERLSKALRRNGHFPLLSGKHLGAYLEERLRAHPIAQHGHMRALAGAASRVHLARLDFGGEWADYYRRKILQAVV